MRRVEFRIDMCLIMRFGHIFDSKVNRGDGVGEEKKCPSGNSHDRLYGSKNIIRFGTTVRGRRRRSSSSSAPHISVLYTMTCFILHFSLRGVNTLGESTKGALRKFPTPIYV